MRVLSLILAHSIISARMNLIFSVKTGDNKEKYQKMKSLLSFELI